MCSYKSLKDYYNHGFFDENIKNILTQGFLNGGREIYLIWEDRNININSLEKLLIGENIQFVVCNKYFKESVLKIDSLINKWEGILITNCILHEKNNLKNTIIANVSSKMGDLENPEYILVSIGGMLSGWNYLNFLYKKCILGDLELHETVDNHSNITISKCNNKIYIDNITISHGERFDNYYLGRMIIKYGKSIIEKFFLNKTLSVDKRNAIKAELYIFFSKLAKANVIREFNIQIVDKKENIGNCIFNIEFSIRNSKQNYNIELVV